MYFLNDSNFNSFTSYPSINTYPEKGSYILYIKNNIVVLPNPLWPTIALVVPDFILIFKFSNKFSLLFYF
jgi:hypothetical protein